MKVLTQQQCPDCEGTKIKGDSKCPHCSGTGRVEEWMDVAEFAKTYINEKIKPE
jgi:DnaJ-class molecular chaperone